MRTFSLAAIASVFILTNVFTALFQQQISQSEGRGWDGIHYYAVAEAIVHGQRPEAWAPFVYRLGTPFLAAVLWPGDLLIGFKVANVLAGAVSTVLLVLLFRLHGLAWPTTALLSALFITHWHSPLRYPYFHPAYSDPWGNTWLFAGILGLVVLRRRSSWPGLVAYSAIVFVGVLFRESDALLALLPFLLHNPIRERGALFARLHMPVDPALVPRPWLALLLPPVAAVAAIVWTHALGTQTNGYSSFGQAMAYFSEKELVPFLYSWWIAFGPVWALVLYDWRRGLAFLRQHQAEAVFALGMVGLTWIGGQDQERLLATITPVVFLLLGRAIEEYLPLLRSVGLAGLLIATQFMAQRVFWTVPDYPSNAPSLLPLLTPPSSSFQFFELFAAYARTRVRVLGVMEYTLLAAVILWWLNFRAYHRFSDRTDLVLDAVSDKPSYSHLA